MSYTIALFGTKPYDEASFNEKNKEFGFELRYYKGHLNKNNVILTQGVDAVCIFVNDVADVLPLRCAGLDVYEEESDYFYEDQSDRIIDDDVLARLLSFNNVIVTSHQAFFTREAMENIAMTTLQNIKDFVNQKPLLNEVKR